MRRSTYFRFLLICGVVISIAYAIEKSIEKVVAIETKKRAASEEEESIKQADRLEKEKAYQEAALIWERLSHEQPDNAYYLYKLGKLYAWLGRYKEAQILLDRSLKIDPKDADVQLSLAYLYLWTDRKDDAKKLFTQILEAYPNYEEAKEGLKKSERVAVSQRDPQKEKEEKAIKQAEAFEKEKAYQEAALIWSSLLKQEPNNATYLWRLGRIYAWTKRYQESEELLDRALKISPKNADIKLALAYLYFWTKREEPAKELFNAILKDYPKYEEAKKGLAEVEKSIQDKDKKEKKEERAKEEPEFEPWQKKWMETAKILEERLFYNQALTIWCYLLARVSHAFSEQIEPLTADLGSQMDEDSVQATRPHPSVSQDRLSEVRFAPRKREKSGLSTVSEVISKESESEKENSKGQNQEENSKEEEPKKENKDGSARMRQQQKVFAYHIGKVLSWKGEWAKATDYLNYALILDAKYDEAWLRLGYVALFSGHFTIAKQIFCRLLNQNLKKPDPDVVEAFARASQALINNSVARKAYCLRSYEPNPTYLIFKQYSYVLKWTNPWVKGTTLYAQERETDLVTKVLSAQRNTFFGSLAGYYPLNDQNRFFITGYGGSEREINLVTGLDNFSVLEWKYGMGYERLMNPWWTLRAWCDVKAGLDIGIPVFPLGLRRRFEPGAVLIYTRPNLTASVAAVRDSFIVKQFAKFNSTFLLRDTYTGQAEYGHFNNWIYTGVLGFYSFYRDRPLNRQWEGQGWVTIGFPQYDPCLFIQYRARVSGFKFTETDYYSYSRQWEHFAKIYYLKAIRCKTELEIGYHRSWQWSRDLNQPVNTAVFVPRLFRITDKPYIEIRYLYRPDLYFMFRADYYRDTTEYNAWTTRGEIQFVF